MKRRLRLVCFLLACSSAALAAGEAPAADALDRFRALAGDWHGTSRWSGARTGAGEMDAHYVVTGGGSAVVENLVSDGVTIMTSVYHRDGADLRMTHYCAAQNQPRLKASPADQTATAVRFSFVDVTNLKSPEAGHVHAFEIRWKDADHVTLVFTFQGGSGTSDETIDLTRARPREAS